MKHLKKLATVVAATVMGAAALVAAPASAHAGAGSLHITPSMEGSAAVYDAYRIADGAGLPQDDQFDWEALSGESLDGRPAYPAYDPASPSAGS